MDMQKMAGPMGADAELAEMSPNSDAAGATELCIEVAADGSLSVYMETGGEEAEQESQRQAAADIGQALALVLKLYKGLDKQEAQSQFQSGFGPEQSQSATPDNKRMGMWR